MTAAPDHARDRAAEAACVAWQFGWVPSEREEWLAVVDAVAAELASDSTGGGMYHGCGVCYAETDVCIYCAALPTPTSPTSPVPSFPQHQPEEHPNYPEYGPEERAVAYGEQVKAAFERGEKRVTKRPTPASPDPSRVTWTQLVLGVDVAAERARQDEKWGEQNHEPPVWLAILTEEVGELGQAILADLFGKVDHSSHSDSMRTEAVQIAAVATGFVEYLDRRARALVEGEAGE